LLILLIHEEFFATEASSGALLYRSATAAVRLGPELAACCFFCAAAAGRAGAVS